MKELRHSKGWEKGVGAEREREEIEVLAPVQDAIVSKSLGEVNRSIAYLSQGCLPQGLGWGSSSEKSEH